MEIGFVETDAQWQEIFRLRYAVYVEEMGHTSGEIDHDARTMKRQIDAHSRVLYASENGRMIGSVAITWGGDHPFDKEMHEVFKLEQFEKDVRPDQMVILTAFCIVPEFRSSSLTLQLLANIAYFSLNHQVQLCFCDCRPHLLNLYTGVGFRTYTGPINQEGAGMLFPLVLVVEDIAYLQQIGSPLLAFGQGYAFSSDVPARITGIFQDNSIVQSQKMANRVTEWSKTFGLLSQQIGAESIMFDDISPDDISRLIRKSLVLKLVKGSQLIFKGSSERVMFIVLSGMLEISNGERVTAVRTRGEVVGEIAFLLGGERMADVSAGVDDTEVLSLNERAVRALLETEPELAARLFYNLSRIVSMKLTALYQSAYGLDAA